MALLQSRDKGKALPTTRAARAARAGTMPVRVSAAAYDALKTLARENGQPMVRYLDALVQDAYRRRQFEQYAEANRLLAADPAALAARRAEEAIWAAADADGLDPEEGVAWDEQLEDALEW